MPSPTPTDDAPLSAAAIPLEAGAPRAKARHLLAAVMGKLRRIHFRGSTRAVHEVSQPNQFFFSVSHCGLKVMSE